MPHQGVDEYLAESSEEQDRAYAESLAVDKAKEEAKVCSDTLQNELYIIHYVCVGKEAWEGRSEYH